LCFLQVRYLDERTRSLQLTAEKVMQGFDIFLGDCDIP
jgi:hypothetical protein